MTTVTLIIDNNNIDKAYEVAYSFACFIKVDESSFSGCKEVSFRCRVEDAWALEIALDEAGLV